MVIGLSVGIMVDKNGGIGMGGGLPKEFEKFINGYSPPLQHRHTLTKRKSRHRKTH
jgi:hypothetical protein